MLLPFVLDIDHKQIHKKIPTIRYFYQLNYMHIQFWCLYTQKRPTGIPNASVLSVLFVPGTAADPYRPLQYTRLRGECIVEPLTQP